MSENYDNVVVMDTCYEVDPCKVIVNFFGFAEKFEIDDALSLVAINATWKNPIIPTFRGKNTIEKGVKGLTFFLSEYEISEVISLFASEERVVFERVEKFKVLWAEAYLQVAGLYVVKNGRIVEWNDYFDWLTLVGKLSLSAVARPVRLTFKSMRSKMLNPFSSKLGG